MDDDHDLWLTHAEQMKKDFEIHNLNMKYHLSESDHWRAKGWKIMYWQWAFVAGAVICTLLNLLVWPSWWWVISLVFSGASFVCAILHGRVMRKARAAHKEFMAVEPAWSIRPIITMIDAEIAEEEAAEKAAKKASRWWRRG